LIDYKFLNFFENNYKQSIGLGCSTPGGKDAQICSWGIMT